MQSKANLLGLLGLIPFVSLPLLVIINTLSLYEATGYFTQYSAIILSFLGGIHWYDSLQRTNKPLQMYLAMLPSIVGWLALILLSGSMALVVLSISFLMVILVDRKLLNMPSAYMKMRDRLTGVVVGCHAIMIWLLSH